ncbi:tRNA lysidine(34) synthetase TilS [Luteimonas aestuarii]|uniref:tRNA lysidine(34) synthetase TilS n=1 Tax=Luteimonas aestuarii TaxID=453837 RepID=UPI003CE51042
MPHVQTGACVWVGYSGGLDSTVLLHALASHQRRHGGALRALHVHHGLHADAEDWARHCIDACAALDVPLDVLQVEVAKHSGEGLEAAARNARHAAFASLLKPGDVLALAHHLDDQAETFLLRALRGAGDGLGAMRAWRRFEPGWLWRPLLDTPRTALLAYAQRHGLRWIDDPTNASEAHDRNFLRRQVMPLLQARWPQAANSLAASAALQRDAVALLEAEDAAALAQVRCADPACVDVERLAALPRERRARVLRRWIGGCGLPPLPAEGVSRIEHDLLKASADTTPAFAWHDAIVRRWRGLLWAERTHVPLPSAFRQAWDGKAPLHLPGSGTLALEGTMHSTIEPTTWIVHARTGGERITLPGRTHSHALKHVLQALGIPPWIRARLPVLSHADGDVLAAGDLVASAAFSEWMQASGLRLRWQPAAA